MSKEDWWRRWLRRRSWWPFTRGPLFEDIEEIFEEMRGTMREEFEELSRKAPEDLMRERTLPDGTKVKIWGPFIYG
ncbi:MAG: hypothetical protein ACOC6G_02080 [Thermoproteota archaeon]